MKKLEEKLEYQFKNINLLTTALTHSSFANEHKKSKIECNERLEFLGDSLLGMITAEYLFRNEPGMPEGKMTRLRAELVCERSLVEVADELCLGDYLRLGHGEESGGGRTRPSIKADAVEAVLAAVFLDEGIEPVKKIVNKYVLSKLKTGITKNRDYKTELQEYLQRDGAKNISYKLTGEDGPDHNKTFMVDVCLDDETIGSGVGKSKKNAEQDAARAALEKLKK